MSFNKRMRRILEICTVILLLLVLATALALKPRETAGTTVDNPVVLNIKTLLYHCPACDLARLCGSDCTVVDLAEAVRRGGKPCRTCGGICAAR